MLRIDSRHVARRCDDHRRDAVWLVAARCDGILVLPCGTSAVCRLCVRAVQASLAALSPRFRYVYPRLRVRFRLGIPLRTLAVALYQPTRLHRFRLVSHRLRCVNSDYRVRAAGGLDGGLMGTVSQPAIDSGLIPGKPSHPPSADGIAPTLGILVALKSFEDV